MIISPLRASPVHDTDSHIIFFNTEALIAKLLMEHTQKRKHRTRTGNRADMSPSSGSRKTAMTSFERQVKHQFLDDGSDSSAVEGQVTKTRRDKKQISPLEVDSAIDIAQIIVSCIHAWDLDSNIDEFCRERLGLLTPRSHVSFGLLSHYGHMALLFPKASAKGIEVRKKLFAVYIDYRYATLAIDLIYSFQKLFSCIFLPLLTNALATDK